MYASLQAVTATEREVHCVAVCQNTMFVDFKLCYQNCFLTALCAERQLTPEVCVKSQWKYRDANVIMPTGDSIHSIATPKEIPIPIYRTGSYAYTMCTNHWVYTLSEPTVPTSLYYAFLNKCCPFICTSNNRQNEVAANQCSQVCLISTTTTRN